MGLRNDLYFRKFIDLELNNLSTQEQHNHLHHK